MDREELADRLREHLDEAEAGFDSMMDAVDWAAEVTPLLRFSSNLHGEFRHRAQFVSRSGLSASFQGDNLDRMRALITEAVAELEEGPYEELASPAQPARAGHSEPPPERLTFRWLWEHVPLSWWGWLAALLLTVFGLGISIGQSEFYARLVTPSKPASAAMPATESTKVGSPAGK